MRKITHYLKIICLKLYPIYALIEELSLSNYIVGFCENRHPCFLIEKYDDLNLVQGRVEIEFLVATKGAGLLLFKDSQCLRLFPHGVFYGITQHNGFWYVYHQIGFTGRIIQFQLLGDKIEGLTVFVWGLSKGIHQIDFISDQLVVVDTYNNRLLVYKDTDKIYNEYWKTSVEVYYPNGKLLQKRKSKNYNHFNSVYSFKNQIYVVAHNETFKTHKGSEVFVLNDDFSFDRKFPTGGSNCHNYYRDYDIELICRSLEGDVILNGREFVAKCNMFTRGLAVAKELFIVGGSSVQFSRELRGQGISNIKIYDKKFQIRAEIALKDVQVQEIRIVSEPDFGLSATSSNYFAKF